MSELSPEMRAIMAENQRLLTELATLRTRAEAAEARVAELEAFRAQVARMTLEGEPNGDGTWFAPNCYADQHETLEALIHQARALTKADMAQRSSPSPRALEWAQAEAEKIEARERAKDAVVEAARAVCGVRGAPVGCGDGGTYVPAEPDLRQLRERLTALDALTKAEG